MFAVDDIRIGFADIIWATPICFPIQLCFFFAVAIKSQNKTHLLKKNNHIPKRHKRPCAPKLSVFFIFCAGSYRQIA